MLFKLIYKDKSPEVKRTRGNIYTGRGTRETCLVERNL